MPELAEVEFYRHQWDCGLNQPIRAVALHEQTRVLRGVDLGALTQRLRHARYQSSSARGKQMLFRFSGGRWLGLHLGMTGELLVQLPDAVPGKHDHLVLFQKERALVFRDARQFGRVRFHLGPDAPVWWTVLPPDVTSGAFTQAAMTAFLNRHRKLPIKAALLLQDGFPGIGNWMADEILWRAAVHPRTRVGELTGNVLGQLWRQVRRVSLGALRHVSPAFGDPPRGWLFRERWSEAGRCPRDRTPLLRETVGGRTAAWCPRCQPQP
jgi:formamidopyrimidine-DNA glycosylase